jgi:tripartite-type tricarboxylate transporter receptor subunit TctC
LSETVPGYAAEVWAGLFAPAKTSPVIIDLLQSETARFLLSGELRTRLQELGLEPVASKPAELQAWVQSQLQRWGRIIQAQKISLD